MKNFLIASCIFLLSTLNGLAESNSALEQILKIECSYPQHPQIPQGVWDQLKPHFLPFNHPIKKKLDKLFETRVTLSTETLKKAGFKTPTPRKISHCVVSKHKKLKGYLVKLYTDDYHETEWQHWLSRIEGLRIVKAAIERHGYQKYFKTPKKWIYPLPTNPAPPQGYFRKYFILIVEDMHVLERDENYGLWKSDLMTKERLTAIYTLLQEEGLYDSLHAMNLPFCSDKKQAFVDTEQYHRWPVPYSSMLRYLTETMQKHLCYLVNTQTDK